MLVSVDRLFEKNNVKIIKIEVKVIDGLDLTGQKYPTASFVSTGFCILLLHTECGLIGVGEPSPYGGNLDNTINAVKTISRDLLGKKLYDAWMYKPGIMPAFSAGYGDMANQAVVAAISHCCIDVLGKKLNLPAYKLFNSESSGVVPAYASGGMIYNGQSLDLYLNEAIDCKCLGFKAWKFRPSTPKGADHFQRNKTPPPLNMDELKWVVSSVSDACGKDFKILLDLGCRCEDLAQAKELCAFLENYNVGFVEEPLPRTKKMYTELVNESNVKIAGGETFFTSKQFDDWGRDNAIDVLQPDLNLVGFREGVKILSLAHKYNKKIVFHNWANGISNIANISLSACDLDVCEYVESSIVYNPYRVDLINDPILPLNGKYILSNKPGLGVKLNNANVKYTMLFD